MKKIGIYGGTFDPIHLGHIKLAEELMKAHALDEVWFCPAYINPHKMDLEPVSAKDRLAMIQLAIEHEPRFKILDTEIFRESPSFMIDTLQELLATQAGKADPHQFYLLLGEDTLVGFLDWKQPLEIVRLVPLLIGRRIQNFSSPDFSQNPEIAEAVEKGWTPTGILGISSTEIRRHLQEGDDCSSFLAGKVLDYITSHRLYYSPYDEKNTRKGNP